MILQRLCNYYDRIAADPHVEIAQEGFAPQKVSFEVVINSDGSLASINDIRDTNGKKPSPRMMRLPFDGRTSGIKAMFLWDKAEYLLGYVPKELREPPSGESDGDRTKREKKMARIGKCFAACRAAHAGFADSINDPAYKSLCQFLTKWSSQQLSESQITLLDEVGTGFGVFRIQTEQRYLHDVPAIKQFWATTSYFCLTSPTAIRTAIPMPATCRVWIPRRDTVW
jgi:CRISPR-associated protein Csd1